MIACFAVVSRVDTIVPAMITSLSFLRQEKTWQTDAWKGDPKRPIEEMLDETFIVAWPKREDSMGW